MPPFFFFPAVLMRYLREISVDRYSLTVLFSICLYNTLDTQIRALKQRRSLTKIKKNLNLYRKGLRNLIYAEKLLVKYPGVCLEWFYLQRLSSLY